MIIVGPEPMYRWPFFFHLNNKTDYIIVYISNILQEKAISIDIIIIAIAIDTRKRIFDHVIIDVKLIRNKVDIEDYATTQRYPSLHGCCIKICPL